jgi:hypothetical protein
VTTEELMALLREREKLRLIGAIMMLVIVWLFAVWLLP